jgi:apolipoprotein N-acyltransferase
VLNFALAAASALLLILAFPRFDAALLAPVALAPLLIAAAREQRGARRFLFGWAAGIAYWFGVCYWIQFVLAVHGGMGETEGWAVFTLFALAKGLHMGVFALLAGPLMRRWWAVPAAAALWTALEATHGSLGFAWVALGNAGIDMGAPMRLAPFTGVYGLSFVFALSGAALALALMRRPRAHLAWLLLLPALYLLPRLPDARRGHETALLIQPNLPESAEWNSESVDQAERRMAALSLRDALAQPQQPPSIIVWPEIPVSLYYEEDPVFRSYADTLARATRAHLLIGVVAHTPSDGPLNSAALIAPAGGLVSRYDKVNLVPFGEYIPWPFGWLTKKISSEAGDFAAGSRALVSPVDGHRIGAFICYEAALPNYVRRFAAGGAQALFTISNDGWFGRSAARSQHLNMVRMRAAENGRWILRAANNGVTATIDSAGRLRGSLPSYMEATSYTGFDYLTATTLYARWGDWFPLLCGCMAALCLIAGRVR